MGECFSRRPQAPDGLPVLDELGVQDALAIAIAGVQMTIEHTNEDETRLRQKEVLRVLQRMARELAPRPVPTGKLLTTST
jgi:hypothetical protein